MVSYVGCTHKAGVLRLWYLEALLLRAHFGALDADGRVRCEQRVLHGVLELEVRVRRRDVVFSLHVARDTVQVGDLLLLADISGGKFKFPH